MWAVRGVARIFATHLSLSLNSVRPARRNLALACQRMEFRVTTLSHSHLFQLGNQLWLPVNCLRILLLPQYHFHHRGLSHGTHVDRQSSLLRLRRQKEKEAQLTSLRLRLWATDGPPRTVVLQRCRQSLRCGEGVCLRRCTNLRRRVKRTETISLRKRRRSDNG